MKTQKENIKNSIFDILEKDYFIYPDSFRSAGELTFFILKDSQKKYLGIIGPETMISESGFSGRIERNIPALGLGGYIIGLFNRDDKNLNKLLDLFQELNPSPLGMDTSFGFGDRLGIANVAHIRLMGKQKGIIPVLAQQSVRELLKTWNDFYTIVKQSIWNIFQEGYEGKWGANADHIDEEILKMTDSIIRERYQLDASYMKDIFREYLGKKSR